MTGTGLWQLTLSNLRAARARSLISAAGIALGIWVLTLVVALGLGARDIVLKEWVRELPLDTLEVVPKTLDMGVFKLNTGDFLGAEPLGPSARDKIAALPHVAAVYPTLDVPLPLGAQGGMRFFGKRLYTDLFMTGLPEALVQPESNAFADVPDVVPVVISNTLIEMYNTTIAPSLGAPQLSADALVGFEFELVIGRSLMLGSRGARMQGVERARIVGVSQYALQLGVSVPMATAERLMARYGEPGQAHYKSILVRAESPEELAHVAEGVEALGYGIDQTAQKTRRVLTTATFIAACVSGLVLLLAALNIAHSFISALHVRRRELAILRAVGARQRDMVLLVLAEAATLGAVGGTLGLLTARGAALAVDGAVRTWLPNLPFKPESFFAFPGWLYIAALGAALAAALAGAMFPALQAARRPVARGLTE